MVLRGPVGLESLIIACSEITHPEIAGGRNGLCPHVPPEEKEGAGGGRWLCGGMSLMFQDNPKVTPWA